MKTLRVFLIATILTVGSLSLANAQTSFHVSVNTPGVHIGVGNYYPYHRVYYAPAPVYYDAAPVYYNPAPVYYNDDNCYNGYRRVVYRGYYRPYYRPYYHRTVVVYRHGGYRRW